MEVCLVRLALNGIFQVQFRKCLPLFVASLGFVIVFQGLLVCASITSASLRRYYSGDLCSLVLPVSHDHHIQALVSDTLCRFARVSLVLERHLEIWEGLNDL